MQWQMRKSETPQSEKAFIALLMMPQIDQDHLRSSTWGMKDFQLVQKLMLLIRRSKRPQARWHYIL